MQARRLRQALEEANASNKLARGTAAGGAAASDTAAAERSILEPMLEARMVWSSPFTRAMQTSLLGMQPILDSGASLVLKPAVREKKNLGGAASCA